MNLFLLLTLLISTAYSDTCQDAGFNLVSQCDGIGTAADAPCGCTCASEDGTTCDGGGDSRCVVKACPTTDTPNNNCPDIRFGDKCYCSTQPGGAGTSSTTTTTPVPKSKAGKSGGKSKGGSSGLGYGDCDCEGGQIDLTIMYQGTNANEVGVKCFNRKENDGPLISDVDTVATGEEFTCTVQGTQYTKLGTETLVVLYNTATDEIICDTQIHTSCSRDIVGTYGADGDSTFCADQLIVTGWRDGNNFSPNDPTNGLRCDDGFEECPCDCTPTVEEPENTPSTTVVNEPEVTVGDVCYCSTSVLAASTSSTTAVPKSKAGKSGSKSKAGKSKGGSSGLGVGDCDCEGGQIDLTVMYQGTSPNEVALKCFNRKENDGPLISDVDTVATGEEFTCTVEGTSYSKLGTETLIVLYNTATDEIICDTQIHTSCSRDIVGTYGADGDSTFCGSQLIVTGWRDGNNLIDGLECDDGFDECPCTTSNPCPPFVYGTDTCDSFTSECCPATYCALEDAGDGLYWCKADPDYSAMNNNDKDNRNVFETMTNKGGSFYVSPLFFIMLAIGLIIGVFVGVIIGKKCKGKRNYNKADKAVEMQIANANANEQWDMKQVVATPESVETDGIMVNNNTTQV